MSLASAYRKFGGAQRKYKGEEGTAKMWGEGTKIAGQAIQFAAEAALPQAEAWQDFEAGQESVGITGEDIQGPKNLWQRATKMPSEIMSGNVTAGGRSYDAASLQMMGTIKSNRDSLGVAAIYASSGGRSLEEIYGKKIEGEDSSSAMTREPTMWENAMSKLKGKPEFSQHYEDGKPITPSVKPVKTDVIPVIEEKKPIEVEEPKVVKPKLDNDSQGTTAEENRTALKHFREKGLLGKGQMLWEMEGFRELGKSRSKRLEFFKKHGITDIAYD